MGRLNTNVKKIRHTNRGQCEAVIKSRMNLIMVNRWPQVASTFVDWGLSFVLFDLYRMFIVEDAIRERNTISALLWNLSIFTFSHRHCAIEIRYLNWIVFFLFYDHFYISAELNGWIILKCSYRTNDTFVIMSREAFLYKRKSILNISSLKFSHKFFSTIRRRE